MHTYLVPLRQVSHPSKTRSSAIGVVQIHQKSTTRRVGKTWASPRGMWPTNAASLFLGPLAPNTSVWSVHVVGTQAITTSTCDSPASTRSQDLIQLQSVMSQATRSMANGRILPRTSCLTLMLAVGTLVLLQIAQQQCTIITCKTDHRSQLVVTGLLPTAGL